MITKDKTIKWLDILMEYSLLALLLTLPFSKTMVEAFFISAFGFWVIKRAICYSLRDSIIKAFKPIKSDLNLPIATFLLVYFLSTLKSVSFSLSMEGLFLKFFEWIMIYFIVAEVINTKAKLRRIVTAIIFSIFFITVDGIVQLITGTDFIRGYQASGHKIRASFGNPNSFGAWLVIMIPLSVSLLYSGTKKTVKAILLSATALSIFCLALTYTRGAWLATIFAIAFIGIFRSKKLLIVLLVILIALSFVLLNITKEHALSFVRFSEQDMERPKLWLEALTIIEDFPLLGTGPNTYASVAPRYRITEKTGYYPHNSYLHMAAESGLLGLAAFIWIIVTLFKTSLADLKKINNNFYSALLIGLLAGLFGFLIHSFVDTNFYSLQLGNLMWFIMGLIVATRRIGDVSLDSNSFNNKKL